MTSSKQPDAAFQARVDAALDTLPKGSRARGALEMAVYAGLHAAFDKKPPLKKGQLGDLIRGGMQVLRHAAVEEICMWIIDHADDATSLAHALSETTMISHEELVREVEKYQLLCETILGRYKEK